ncbi:MAG TPA: outer membrane lipoprotein chaperone LolA [Arenimonas sp.]|uniref:outer membrane lipoprotein chaperone LolA n=1 Tax=Arenimonas sp. TaxID=1872635 RepID=UPI002D7F35B1|nr:outer membrane lipoprotein chaperone LolA [Arenimonas sp.]HEU0153560.1 outer membrane lipoprotein chaperone LolA [Arenimonas sp.]
MRKLLVLSLVLVAGIAHAGAREQLDVFSNGVQGLAATFEQRVYDAGGALRETSSGTVQLQAPRQFRWEYLKPYPQLIVADGDHIWIYDPDMEQVTVRQQSLEEQNSPLAMLIDIGQMERQFKVTEGGQGQGLSWLELAPRKPEEAPFDRARLGFGPAGLVRMEMFDGLGQRTVMGFSAWKRNPAFAAGTFVFVKPEGVDQIGEVAESAEVIPLRD